VTVACPATTQATIASIEPSYMTVGLPTDSDGCLSLDAIPILYTAAASCNCLAIGPGLGRSAATCDVVTDLCRTLEIPMVIDADALHALAASPSWVPRLAGTTVLTPHPGEFRRMIADHAMSVAACRAMAPDWAKERGIVLVLKGHHTLVTDGQRTDHNATGNPGMATGGMGDVLTGVIAGLIAQGMSTWDAARLGVHVHGLAGDLAARQLGEISLMASDIPDFLPAAFQQTCSATVS
jgi:NAD(P)H-hydrate epimerase